MPNWLFRVLNLLPGKRAEEVEDDWGMDLFMEFQERRATAALGFVKCPASHREDLLPCPRCGASL